VKYNLNSMMFHHAIRPVILQICPGEYERLDLFFINEKKLVRVCQINLITFWRKRRNLASISLVLWISFSLVLTAIGEDNIYTSKQNHLLQKSIACVDCFKEWFIIFLIGQSLCASSWTIRDILIYFSFGKVNSPIFGNLIHFFCVKFTQR